MNRLTLTLALLAAVPLARAAGPNPAHPAAPAVPIDLTRFNEFPINYKAGTQVPAGFFNPFKIQAMTDALAKHDTAAVNNDAITTALTHKGLSGFVCATAAEPGRAILGDEVFATGDEITFPSEGDPNNPVVTGAVVILREVAADHIVFDVTPTGENTRTVSLPLRAFWH